MIAYLKGILEEKREEEIVIEVNGMGYSVRVPLSVVDELPAVGTDIKLYTYLYVREDAMKLYGFLTKEDLEIFRMLITVSGIGPKGGLGILSAVSPDDLRFAILSEDVKTISKAPGIGTKTARKLILELKDKMSLEEAFEQKLNHVQQAEVIKTDVSDRSSPNVKAIREEAVQALTALGYSSTDALKAVRKVEVTENMTVEALLKQSLKYML